MSDASLPPYEYRCVDQSLLVGPFRRYWVVFFARAVPWRVPANLVTLLASACMWALLAAAIWVAPADPAARAWLFAALLHAYVVYDHVDGLHAKRCGTSSRLGEYLDHSLDVYHGAIAVLAVFSLLGFGQPALVLLLIGCSHLAFAATMVEEKERGELHFGRLGSLEGALLCVGFCASWSVGAVRAWWLAPLIGGWPAYALLALVGVIGTLVAVADCLRRIGRLPQPFLWFALGHGILIAALARAEAPLWGAVATLMLHGGDYAGRVIGSHLLRTRHPMPDFVAPTLGVAALLLTPAEARGVLLPWLPGHLALWTVRGAIRVLDPLRRHWQWINPPAALPRDAAP